MEKAKGLVYTYMGQIERCRRGEYYRAKGYSYFGESGGIVYPWMTKREARKDAHSRGGVACFVE